MLGESHKIPAPAFAAGSDAQDEKAASTPVRPQSPAASPAQKEGNSPQELVAAVRAWEREALAGFEEARACLQANAEEMARRREALRKALEATAARQIELSRLEGVVWDALGEQDRAETALDALEASLPATPANGAAPQPLGHQAHDMLRGLSQRAEELNRLVESFRQSLNARDLQELSSANSENYLRAAQNLHVRLLALQTELALSE